MAVEINIGAIAENDQPTVSGQIEHVVSSEITITKEQLRSVIEWHLSSFKKDVSDQWHDVREYENLGEQDYNDFADGVYSDLLDVISC